MSPKNLKLIPGNKVSKWGVTVDRRKPSGLIVVLVGLALSFGVQGCAADPPDGPSIAALSDFKVQLSSTPVHLGTNSFVVNNKGQQEHEFIGFKIDRPVAALEMTPDGDLNEDVLTSVTDGPNLAPRESSTRTVELKSPGTYLFLCNLPGHFKKGMYTIVTLS